MFEKASAIRAAQREKMLWRAREKAVAKLGRKDPATGAVTLTPEAMASLNSGA